MIGQALVYLTRSSKRGLVFDRRLMLGMYGMLRTRPSQKKIWYAVDSRRSSKETTRAEAQLNVAVDGSMQVSDKRPLRQERRSWWPR